MNLYINEGQKKIASTVEEKIISASGHNDPEQSE